MTKRRAFVTVEIDSVDVPCGVLNQNVRNNRESVTFSYDPSYLEAPGAFALSPDMPLGGGSFHSAGLDQLRAFGDCMPDRWGRNLMRREEARVAAAEGRAPRTLFELDMLCGVNDAQRQGAIRLWDEDGKLLAPPGEGVPREVDLPALLSAADLAADNLTADVHDLFAAGSSLGGARPKASVCDAEGGLYIAKFPRKDESKIDDVCAWEKVALDILAACGLEVPESRLLRISGRSVLLVGRFDRRDGRRVPYMSGLTAIGGHDGEDGYSYLDLVDFLSMQGSRAQEDKVRLWQHALLSAAIGNTDNHMRNFGFLREKNGWRLSPFFDVNPTRLESGNRFAVGVADDGSPHDVAACMALASLYDVDNKAAREFAARAAEVVSRWRQLAAACGICEASVEAMRLRMESAVRNLGRLA